MDRIPRYCGQFPDFHPGHPTSKVVKTGVFAISRNPLYLGGSILLLGITLILNTLWSIFFFGLQSPTLAFIEIIFLWAAIILTAFLFYQVSKPAAYLLLPYILWVSFAAVLNYSFMILNW